MNKCTGKIIVLFLPCKFGHACCLPHRLGCCALDVKFGVAMVMNNMAAVLEEPESEMANDLEDDGYILERILLKY